MSDPALPHLRSTISGQVYPFDRLEEFADNGEALEVVIPAIDKTHVRPGAQSWQRFADFLPFTTPDPAFSLNEGDTPLITAAPSLQQATGIPHLLLKDETRNPTWSFKDRGSLTCAWMARTCGEATTATISTGNMGHSIAAYAARAGLRALVFVPHFAPMQKIQSAAIHGATVIRVTAPDYAQMKGTILGLASRLGLRIVSGNGPIRSEGYKLASFEIYEQLGGAAPDFIAVPTSACGHIRGLWKGWVELKAAGLIDRLPRMIVVQATNNSPLVTSIKHGLPHVTPFTDFHTIAEAITSGNPQGGDEILDKAARHHWLAESVTEDEILDGQRLLARAGHFVEPATATSVHAVRKLRETGRISPHATVVLMLTGSGLKDMDSMGLHNLPLTESTLESVAEDIFQALA